MLLAAVWMSLTVLVSAAVWGLGCTAGVSVAVDAVSVVV